MLSELQDTFKSNIKALEIFLVLKGAKPAARIMADEDEEDKILGIILEKGLNYSISDFKVLKVDKEKGYSDKGIKVDPKSNENGDFFVYISKDKDITEKAKILEAENKHKELGILLGYPSCCAEFFEKHFEEESKRNNDFTLAVLKSSDGFSFPFYTNIGARHFDLALLSHFPCSFSCAASLEIAKKNLELIKQEDKEFAEVIEGMLKGAIVYTETEGVFLLRNPELEHNRICYQGIISTKNNQMYESLKNAEHIDIISKNRIKLGDLEIKNIGFMLFF
ncbi:MAG: hypothetical protein KKC75_04245 [Nanoarchaeota archaeon]|nr:hypothetical protein [Nanoarchaeota archaeon]MBU1005367.1 hypothetical protein [Nanoarchaeota archaeon]MBU1946077.1 hypothetical protein [Nanoarchaeota archaeon]